MGRTVGAALRGRPRFEHDAECGRRPRRESVYSIEGGHGGPPLQYVLSPVLNAEGAHAAVEVAAVHAHQFSGA